MESQTETQIEPWIEPWIGVDLDGTLAYYDHWRGPEHIGSPILSMQVRVENWLADGMQVKIFTARACIPSQILPVEQWLKKIGLPNLEVTNCKDFGMVELWDDRCVQVITNTGMSVDTSFLGDF